MSLRIMYLEDNPDHVTLVGDALSVHYPHLTLEKCSLLAEAFEILHHRRYDVILCSAILHGELVIPKLSMLVQISSPTPVIIIAGAGDEKLAANAIKQGAVDYIVKSRETLELLPYLIQRLTKKRKSVQEEKPVETRGIDYLLQDIDDLSRRIHRLQENIGSEASVASLREEMGRLEQFARQLAKDLPKPA